MQTVASPLTAEWSRRANRLVHHVEQKKVPGTIDCLSDVFVLGLWRVLFDFYSAV